MLYYRYQFVIFEKFQNAKNPVNTRLSDTLKNAPNYIINKVFYICIYIWIFQNYQYVIFN